MTVTPSPQDLDIWFFGNPPLTVAPPPLTVAPPPPQDMDIWFFGNPLKMLWEAAPDADLAISTEIWIDDHTFVGDVCMTHGPHCMRPSMTK